MTRFAFVAHLGTFEDIVYMLHIPKFLIPLLRPILRIFPKLGGRLGFSVKDRFKIGGKDEAEGYIIIIWLTGEQVMAQPYKARQRVLEAVLYAQNKLQCKIIGLGSLTSSVTDGGEWLSRRKEIKASLTHGDSYSVAVAIEGIKEIIAARKNHSEITLAIVGATGVIGKAIARQVLPITKNLILIGRNSKKLEELKFLAEKSGDYPKITTSLDIEDINEADIVVTATSWSKTVIQSCHLKEKAVIYEVSQPRNVPESILLKRPDIIVIDGARVKVPDGIKFWWMNLFPHVTFACMSETMMQALEKDFNSHIGEIDPEFVKETERRAKMYGFLHAPFTSFNKPL